MQGQQGQSLWSNMVWPGTGQSHAAGTAWVVGNQGQDQAGHAQLCQPGAGVQVLFRE